jgi:hypothetical protein
MIGIASMPMKAGLLTSGFATVAFNLGAMIGPIGGGAALDATLL